MFKSKFNAFTSADLMEFVTNKATHTIKVLPKKIGIPPKNLAVNSQVKYDWLLPCEVTQEEVRCVGLLQRSVNIQSKNLYDMSPDFQLPDQILTSNMISPVDNNYFNYSGKRTDSPASPKIDKFEIADGSKPSETSEQSSIFSESPILSQNCTREEELQVVIGDLIITNFQVRFVHLSPKNKEETKNKEEKEDKRKALGKLTSLFQKNSKQKENQPFSDSDVELVVRSIPLGSVSKIQLKSPLNTSDTEQEIYKDVANILEITGKHTIPPMELLFYNDMRKKDAVKNEKLFDYWTHSVKGQHPVSSESAPDVQQILEDSYIPRSIDTCFALSFGRKESLPSKLRPNTRIGYLEKIMQEKKLTENFGYINPNDKTDKNQIVNNPNFNPYPTTFKAWLGFNSEEFFTLDFMRQNSKTFLEHWRFSNCNANFELCESYPDVLAVPKNIDDQTFVKAAGFRSKKRAICLTWCHPSNGTFMVRCSQPMAGLGSIHRNPADEKLFKEIYLMTNLIQAYLPLESKQKHLNIIDVRPQLNAIGNSIVGKGVENAQFYEHSKISFSGVGNIHVMTNSLIKLKKSTSGMVEDEKIWDWKENLKTGWCSHISKLLVAACEVARKMEEGSSVMIHCSDGWDRTSGLCALSQIILDPYYRTIEGFCVLIMKDWISFGHKFSERLGNFFHGEPNPEGEETTSESTTSSTKEKEKENKKDGKKKKKKAKERSPIFFQFLDCVYHLMRQHPGAFEFNEAFLTDFVDGITSFQFGDFLHNTLAERKRFDLHNRTYSLFQHLWQNLPKYQNAEFGKVLLLQGPNCIGVPKKRFILSPINCSPSFLVNKVWVDCYFGLWRNPQLFNAKTKSWIEEQLKSQLEGLNTAKLDPKTIFFFNQPKS